MNYIFLFSRWCALRLAGALTVVAMTTATAAADTENLAACLKLVHAIKHTDNFVKVEYLSTTQEGDPSFEIEARDAHGREWEFMCEASDGDIYEVEQETASADNALFKKNVNVSEQQARGIVTNLYPGTIKEIEYEIESTGDATYEIDVVDDENTEWKVEVDAGSGDIIETHIELWEIGDESEEQTSK
jgi:uncharacterized membrane protein YkoI